MKVAIILPFFNESEVAPLFLRALKEVLYQSIDSYEIVAIDDGSTDNTYQTLSNLLPNDDRYCSHLLSFHQNYGHEKALRAGIEFSISQLEFDCLAVMDSDLQDPPAVLVKMLDIFRAEKLPVFARSTERQDGISKKILASLYYWIQASIINAKEFSQVRNFFVISPKVSRSLDMGTKHFQSTRVNLFELVGKNSIFLDFQRDSRHAGTTHYSIKDSLQLAMDGLLSQPKRFLVLLEKFIFLSLVMSVSLGIYIIYFKFFSSEVGLPGLALILLSNSLFFSFFGILFYFVIAIITRIYTFTRGLPSYVVTRIDSLDE